MGFAMWTRLALVLGLALVLAGVGAERSASAQEVLTNDSVIGLVKAGLPESVVIQKIRSTAAAERKFDTSTDGLIKLKKAGVPDKVIEAMVSAPGTPAAAAPAAAGDPTIAHVKGGGQTLLKPIHGGKGMSAAPFVGSRQEVAAHPEGGVPHHREGARVLHDAAGRAVDPRQAQARQAGSQPPDEQERWLGLGRSQVP